MNPVLQKLLIVVLGIASFVGASRLIGDLVDRPSRLVAGAVYMFSAVGYAGLRGGSLGALMFGAYTVIAFWKFRYGGEGGTYMASDPLELATLSAAMLGAWGSSTSPSTT